jgi:hypothetical protein
VTPDTDARESTLPEPATTIDAGNTQSSRPEGSSRRLPQITVLTRILALPMMVVFLGLYVMLHSPLRRAVGNAFGFTSADCYPCGGTPGVERFVDSVAALSLLALATLAAGCLASWFVGTQAEKALALGLLALAFVVVPASVIGVIGTVLDTGLLRAPSGPLLSATPAVVVLVLGLRRGWRPRLPRPRRAAPGRLLLLVGALSGILLIGSVVISLTHPPTQGDALSYHAPLALLLWSDGNLSAFLDRSPDVWALAHPGTAELWFGVLRIVGGEHLANLGQLPFAFLAATAVGVFAWRLGLRGGAPLLAACAFLLSPLVVLQLGMQANDLLGSAVLMATMALACAPVTTWDLRRIALIGVGLGLTATTKIALVPSVAALAVFCLGALAWGLRGRGVRSLLVPVLVGALTFTVVVSPWWARNLARFDNPVYPGNLPVLGHGVPHTAAERIDTEFVPSPIAWPLYPLLEPQDDRSGLGALFAVGVLPGLLLAARRARRHPLFLYATVTLLTLPAWWGFTLHEPRFLLPSLGFAFAFLPFSLMLLRGRRRIMGLVTLAAAAVFSTLVTLEQGLAPFARHPTARAEFYDRVWGVDPVVSSLPVETGILLHTGYGPPFSDYAAYYPLLGPSQEGRQVVVADASGHGSTDAIVTTMRRAGIRFAYVSAVPAFQSTVKQIYDSEQFQLVRRSAIEVGENTAARRYVYTRAALDDPNAIQRYLFRLR